MHTKALLAVLIPTLSMVPSLTPPIYAAAASPDVENLVREFPTLDELEAHMGCESACERADPIPTSRAQANSEGREGSIFPVSARWFTAPPATDPFSAPTSAPNAQPGEKPLASSLANMDAAQKEAGAIGKEIGRQDSLPINRFLFDRVTFYARTDYGTAITGLFGNGIGFGTYQRSFLQSYGATYSLPLFPRFSGKSKWTRILSGLTITSSIGAMSALSQTLQLQQFLNNVELSWNLSLSYNLSSSTIRKIQDGQYNQEAALSKAAGRATAAREELLKKMALRIDALSASRPARDTRLLSLRELYPQFELYQARYDQATSCDERMEDFFTLKGLALSLLTLAGYDRRDDTGSELLQTWKRARFVGCARAS